MHCAFETAGEHGPVDTVCAFDGSDQQGTDQLCCCEDILSFPPEGSQVPRFPKRHRLIRQEKGVAIQQGGIEVVELLPSIPVIAVANGRRVARRRVLIIVAHYGR